MTPEVKSHRLRRYWQQFAPGDPNRASHGEKWLSAAGGFIGILALLWVSSGVLDHWGAALVVTSMGASTVLLFAVPHGALSQPWPLLGGHLLSAVIGVTCAQQVADPIIAAAAAVALSIVTMYYLHCLHPPGGATALAAVVGGDAVHQLGYAFVVTPVLANGVVLLVVAMLVNLPFHWRRYPVEFAGNRESEAPVGEKAMIAHSDLVYALSQLDSFIDVTERDLIRIYTLAVHHAHDPVPCHLRGRECDVGSKACLCRRLAEAQV